MQGVIIYWDIADPLDGTEVAAMWQLLATKDIDEGLEVVSERIL
ncbi:hypothetical protein BPA01_46650 [Brevibacillus parabrevis]|jgi:hypothetical protein|uniref:Uncharacterized protein n=1 Tax=Brevibacillus parabrevis TaxID=54914 RepID=A0A4Y3PQA9_BREPA|nr:hypothetical protein BPA01_46650 [Brevibacillus parabrevis]